MLCPLNIAPNGSYLNPVYSTVESMVFSEDQVQFSGLLFHGIKNDYQRDGFAVTIPSASDHKLDPVSALSEYMCHTKLIRNALPGRPVFITLRKPYHALGAKSISGILQDSIHTAGLSGQGYTAKCFRPTGATRAIDINVHPDKARHIGRWASQEVFEKHYVNTRVPDHYVDNLVFGDSI